MDFGNNEQNFVNPKEKYKRMKVLGRGGAGTVFLVKSFADGEFYALKQIPKKEGKSQLNMRYYKKMIEHPHVVKFYETFSDDRNDYLVSEYCEGGNLGEYISQNGVLPLYVAVAVFRNVVDAVGFIHSQGIVHRDIKPENVLIKKLPDVRLADFGLAAEYAPGMKLDTFCGTTQYSAPECLMGVEYNGVKADIWSLGVLFYAMLVGKTPWSTNDTKTVSRQILSGYFTIPAFIHAEAANLIKSILKLNPENRPTIEEIKQSPLFSLKLQPIGTVTSHKRGSYAAIIRKKTNNALKNPKIIIPGAMRHCQSSLRMSGF